MISGTCLDLIWDTLGGLGKPIWWFLGYWRLLEILMNFRVSPEPPQAKGRRTLGGKLFVRGVQYTSNNTRLLTCRTSNCRYVELLMEYWKKLKDESCKVLASQPDGPWQAGAGGYIYIYMISIGWMYTNMCWYVCMTHQCVCKTHNIILCRHQCPVDGSAGLTKMPSSFV